MFHTMHQKKKGGGGGGADPSQGRGYWPWLALPTSRTPNRLILSSTPQAMRAVLLCAFTCTWSGFGAG